MDEHAFFELAGKGFHFAFFERHRAVGQSKERVVSTPLDVFAGMILGATLADEHVSFMSGLATINLHTESFGDGIAAEGG